ncbi:hypothetical protein OPQ81_010850 [Rhizoctonia solani]|nr:hypothetical protein OPQ81_010850 [Rhizoctonia solani]
MVRHKTQVNERQYDLLSLGFLKMGSSPSAVAEFHGNSANFYLKVPTLHKAFVLNGVNEMTVITSNPLIVNLYYTDPSVLSGSLSTAHTFIDGAYSMAFYKPGTLDRVASVSVPDHLQAGSGGVCTQFPYGRDVMGRRNEFMEGMTKSLYLSNQVKATLSLAGSENIMTVIAPEIRRRFAGKRVFSSPWAESSIEPIQGTLSYLHAAQLTGESDATVEIIGNRTEISFRLVDPGPGLEDVTVAVFKGQFIPYTK